MYDFLIHSVLISVFLLIHSYVKYRSRKYTTWKKCRKPLLTFALEENQL